MNFDLSEEQKMLAEQANALLADRSPFDHLRGLIDSGAEWDEPLWRELAEMGFLGAAIPEAYGGLGLSALDLGVLAAEFGRTNAAVPFFSSIVLAAEAILMAGSEEQKAEWLPKLASGEIVATLAYSEGPGALAPAGVAFAGDRVTGVKTPVADAGIADIALVLTDAGLAIVRLDAPGVVRSKLDAFDHLRAHYRLEFTGAPGELLARPIDMQALFDRAAVQAAFEATGAAEACLIMARDYALERQMFGRSLASYQAIKHKLADIAVQVELVRSNAYFAGWAAGESAGELPAAAAAARLTAISAFEAAARENLQVHGGIGYTQEANCHFFYRRERLLAVNIGNRDYWAARLIQHIPASQAEAA